MEQPPGFAQPGKDYLVCKLYKSLYDLKQSPRMQYQKIDSYLKSIEMTKSHDDYNLYYVGEGKDKTILVVYVDDLFVK